MPGQQKEQPHEVGLIESAEEYQKLGFEPCIGRNLPVVPSPDRAIGNCRLMKQDEQSERCAECIKPGIAGSGRDRRGFGFRLDLQRKFGHRKICAGSKQHSAVQRPSLSRQRDTLPGSGESSR